MSLLPRAIRGLNAASRMVAGALLLLMTFALFVDIVARNFADYSFIGTAAIGTYTMVWLTFIGAAFIVPTHGHVAVDILLRAVGVRYRRLLVILTALGGMATSAYMAVIGLRLTRFVFGSGQLETTLNISPGFLYLPVAIGMTLMFLNYADLLVAMLRKDDARLPSIEFTAAAGEPAEGSVDLHATAIRQEAT